MVDRLRIRRLLEDDRTATVARRDGLARELRQVVAATTDVATDDEHDPEGQTIAYERARTAALIHQADEHLADIDTALARLDAGSYNTCERCGARIPAERLAARPVARTCVSCAAARR